MNKKQLIVAWDNRESGWLGLIRAACSLCERPRCPSKSEGERAETSSEIFLGGENRAVLREQAKTGPAY